VVVVTNEFTGERPRPDDAPAPAPEGEEQKQESAILSVQGRLTEWHAMTPDDRLRHWGDLVDWVIWLYDTYELGREYRLPKCWPQHPGLVQELWALKCWREALYTDKSAEGVTNGRRAGALASHAISWHNELRSLAAQIKFYTPKCLTGHKRSTLAEDYPDDDLRAAWTQADPLGGVRAPNPAAQPVAVLDERDMRRRLAAGTAEPHPAGLLSVVTSHGHWWIGDLETGTWQRADDERISEQLDLLADGYDESAPGLDDLSNTQIDGSGPDPA
jgi:hypothetical protein